MSERSHAPKGYSSTGLVELTPKRFQTSLISFEVGALESSIEFRIGDFCSSRQSCMPTAMMDLILFLANDVQSKDIASILLKSRHLIMQRRTP